jgi:quinol monooxygenase YgiN
MIAVEWLSPYAVIRARSNAMILITARGRVHADQRDAALAAAADMCKASSAEDGCLEYSYWISGVDSLALMIFERWDNEEALTSHMSTPHMATFIGAIGGVLDGGMDAVKHQVSSSGPLF